MKYGFGIDLGGTTVKIAYFDENGSLLDKWEIPTVADHGGEQILPDIASSIADYLFEKQIDASRILGIGIGVPGPVDSRGVVNRCINLGWGVFNIAEKLESLTGFPVMAANDANAAALGEYWKGGGRGCDNMVFVTLGTGVGGGIVVDGHMLHGAHGSAAEIGHLILNRQETVRCNCGNFGCAEQYCSATGIVRMARNYLRSTDAPSPLRTFTQLTCKDVFDAGKGGDPVALAILDQVYEYLGQLLGMVCSTVDPDSVVLGGGVSKAGQILLDGVYRTFRKYTFHAATDVSFKLAALGNDAGAYGAFKLALDAFG